MWGAVVTKPPFGADFQPCSAEQPRSGVADGVCVMARQHRVTGSPRLCQASRQQQPTAGSSACWQEQPSASDERSSIAGTERCAFASLLCGGDEPRSRTRSAACPCPSGPPPSAASRPAGSARSLRQGTFYARGSGRKAAQAIRNRGADLADGDGHGGITASDFSCHVDTRAEETTEARPYEREVGIKGPRYEG